jgi:hypothetical protein
MHLVEIALTLVQFDMVELAVWCALRTSAFVGHQSLTPCTIGNISNCESSSAARFAANWLR